MRLDEFGNVILDEDLNQNESPQTRRNNTASQQQHQSEIIRKKTRLKACFIVICILAFVLGFSYTMGRNSSGVKDDYTSEEYIDVDSDAGSEYIPSKVTGHLQVDEADMLDIVWHFFSKDTITQVYCADYDGDGWMEAFVEEKIDAEDEYKRIWFMNHNEETSLVSEGGYLYLADTISLPNAVLMVVNTRHGLDTVYYVENGSVGVVDMPDDEWWYSIYKENETLWGTRVEYSDGKNYVDYPLEYDASLHRLYIFEGC